MSAVSIVVLAFAGISIIGGLIAVYYANKANERMRQEENKTDNKNYR